MPRAREYAYITSPTLKWRRPKGDPEGMDEAILNEHEDGSYTHVLRIRKGVEISEPVTHDFYEEALYLEGEMLNTKTGEKITRGAYVFHRPGEPHGPFKALKDCLLLEFRYYK